MKLVRRGLERVNRATRRSPRRPPPARGLLPAARAPPRRAPRAPLLRCARPASGGGRRRRCEAAARGVARRGRPSCRRPRRASAASATVLAMGPEAVRPCQCAPAPPGSGTNPGVGFTPTRPQQAAGMRSDPPPSEPSASGAMPDATAAAPPPVEPPGVRLRSHGLRVGRNAAPSVKGQIASSGICVLPMTMQPAARRRRTRSSSRAAGAEPVAAEPWRVGAPTTSTLSFTATGTPASGSSSRSRRSSSASASASASSRRMRANAPSSGSRASMRARCVRTTSTGLTSCRLTWRAIATAGALASSRTTLALPSSDTRRPILFGRSAPDQPVHSAG